MLSFSLTNAISLTTASIDANITRKNPGVYVLGPSDPRGGVTVNYVGRSDTDLAARLKTHVGKYTHFVFATATSASDAFVKECEMYHEWSPTANEAHPARPENSLTKCPRCRTFG
jgi:hypothetical protein